MVSWSCRLQYICSAIFVGLHRSKALLNVEIALLGYTAPNSHPALVFNGPAVDLAVAELNNASDGKIHYNVTYLVINEPNCLAAPDGSTALLAKWYYQQRNTDAVPILLAPGCIDMRAAEQLVSSWDVLLIASVGVFETGQNLPGPRPVGVGAFSRPSFQAIFFNLLSLYNWNNFFAVIDDDSPPLYTTMAVDVITQSLALKTTHVTVEHLKSGKPKPFEALLARFRVSSRVMAFYGRANQLRRLLIAACMANLTNGEFVYVAFEPFESQTYGKMSWNYSDSFDEVAREAFGSLLVIQQDHAVKPTPRHSPQWLGLQFQKEAMLKYNISYPLDEQPLPDIMATYVSVFILDRVLEESQRNRSGSTQVSGTELSSRFLGRSFETDIGWINFDQRGRRRDATVVCYFGAVSGIREPFLLQPAESRLGHGLILLKNHTDWPGGIWPPLNEPMCGYSHQSVNPKCFTSSEHAANAGTIAAVSGGLFSLLVLLVAALWRRKHTIDQRSTTWWRIEAVGPARSVTTTLSSYLF